MLSGRKSVFDHNPMPTARVYNNEKTRGKFELPALFTTNHAEQGS